MSPLLNCLDYESRNLGMAAYAVNSDYLYNPVFDELRSSILAKIEEHGKVFVQAKVEYGQWAIRNLLERCGFFFVETTVIISTILNTNRALVEFSDNRDRFVPEKFKKSLITFSKVAVNDISTINGIRKIAEETFIHDRFHNDPHCPSGLASARYVHWVDDMLLDKEVVLEALSVDQEIIGFMARKKDHLILAGLLRKYVSSGFGQFIWLSSMKSMTQEGIGKAWGQITITNMPSLNLHASLNYRFSNPAAIFHYWH